MRRAILSLCAAAVLALASAVLGAGRAARQVHGADLFLFPDFDLGLVVFINMDRETFCTPEQVAWEEAFLAWLEGGEVGDPPEPPVEPDGFDLVVDPGEGDRAGRDRAGYSGPPGLWPRSGSSTRMRR